MSNSYIWPIDRAILGATTPGQGGPVSIAVYIPPNSKIVLCHMQDIRGGTYPSVETQSVYSTAQPTGLSITGIWCWKSSTNTAFSYLVS